MNIKQKIENSIVGLKCIQAKIGYADVVKLDFGKKIYYKHPKLQEKYYGEVSVSIETFNWRILNEQNVICGSSDNYKNAENGLSNLIGQKVIEIETKPNDLKIRFDNNLELIAYKSTVEKDDLVFLDIENSNGIHNFIYTGTEWEIYVNNGLSTEELALESFSKKTTERWNLNVPKIGNNNFCKNCSYFIEIAGRFYFWDYGVCSNKKSEFDGKITNAKSTCKYYSKELEKD